ncbi:flagellar motor switch protein FliN [Salinicola halophilus]|uniref:flagellar motor switch protein FliN n=1 Tax=Salinicola halophilus TaxID=184065 RepID=UPI000DA24AC9|nr:flagellar motor switch protein FliN [Salinicola halophilus]
MSDDNKPASQTDDAASSATPDPDDLWAAAMAEQGVTSEPEPSPEPEPAPARANAPKPEAPKPEASTPATADAGVFPSFDEGSDSRQTRDLNMIMDIPVKLSVELGRTRITIKQLLELAQGSVVELDGLAGEPMDILINGYLIAQGEVVVVEDKYGIRVTEIITPSERVQKLNR